MEMKVIVGFDGSAESLDALALAKQIVEPAAAELHVAAVLWVDDPDDHRERCERLFSRARRELGPQRFLEHPIRDVSAPKALHELAVAESADLVVLGSTHWGTAGRVVFGSVAERLLHGGPCAVAVAPKGFRRRPHTGFDLIGVGYDAGEESRRALSFAERLANPHEAGLRLIGVVPEQPPVGPDAPDELREAREPLIERYRGQLNNGVESLHGRVEAETKLAEGDPAAVLADQSVELDLLVLGSRGYGPVLATLLGAVSAEVMRTAPCPVVVTPREAGTAKEADEVTIREVSGRILVGFDGSDQGKDALHLAKAIAAAENAKLIVASVYEPESAFDGSEIRLPLDVAKAGVRRKARMERIFSQADLALGSSGYERRELWGSPAHELNTVAESEHVDLIVLGSTHQGTLGRVLSGSVGERLLHGAPCAVAIAPVGYADRDHFGTGIIGVGYNGSEESKLALRRAESLARDLDASLRLITATPEFSPVLPKPGMVPPPDYRGLIRDDFEKMLSTTVAGIQDVHAEYSLVDGDPADVLAAEGAELDLLVVGSRGYGPLRRTLLGGVSAKIMRSAPCPVLVTPRGTGRPSESPQVADAHAGSRPVPE